MSRPDHVALGQSVRPVMRGRLASTHLDGQTAGLGSGQPDQHRRHAHAPEPECVAQFRRQTTRVGLEPAGGRDLGWDAERLDVRREPGDPPVEQLDGHVDVQDAHRIRLPGLRLMTDAVVWPSGVPWS